MAGYDIGGGGGIPFSDTSTARTIYAKPYDIPTEWGPEVANRLDEMLRQLYEAANRTDDVGLKLSGTVASDENIVVFDGTSGTLVKDGGVLATDVLVTRTVISHAQILTLSSSPVTIVAAPASTKIIQLIDIFYIKDTSAGGYGTLATVRPEYTGSATDLFTAQSLLLTSANFAWFRPDKAALSSASDVRGNAIQLLASADNTGGNSANYIVVDAVYTVVEANNT